MRLSQLLILFVILTASSKSEARPDTTYYNGDMQKTELYKAEYYCITNLMENHLYKVANYYIKNNKLQMAGFYSSLDSNIKEGLFVNYDENGNILKEGVYNSNKKNGEWKYYYPDSKNIWYMEHYDTGQIVGDLISYYKSGKIKRRETHKLYDTTVTGYCFEESGESRPFTPFVNKPKPGCNINEFLSNNLHYPEKALEDGIEGIVIISFLVLEDGSLTDAKIEKSIYDCLDTEALRVVKKMPNWIPGTMDDIIGKWYTSLPIVFKLE